MRRKGAGTQLPDDVFREKKRAKDKEKTGYNGYMKRYTHRDHHGRVTMFFGRESFRIVGFRGYILDTMCAIMTQIRTWSERCRIGS